MGFPSLSSLPFITSGLQSPSPDKVHEFFCAFRGTSVAFLRHATLSGELSPVHSARKSTLKFTLLQENFPKSRLAPSHRHKWNS